MKSFLKQLWEASKRETKRLDGQNERWMLKNPNLTILFGAGVLIICIFCLASLADTIINPAPPAEPQQAFTFMGFVGWLAELQLPPILWVIILILLWLTKW